MPKKNHNFLLAVIGVLLLMFTACSSPESEAKSPATSAPENKAPASTSTKPPTAALPSPTVPRRATKTPTETAAPTETILPTDTQSPAVELHSCLPDNTPVEQARVVKIVDGDTIDVEMDGQVYAVRYIGMDTPETQSGTVEPFGEEAAAKNRELVAGKEIQMVKDKSETDRYDRLLRYVFVGDTFVNEELVKEGLAEAKQYPPDTSCHVVLSSAQDTAKLALLGMWGATAMAPEPTLEISSRSGSISACPDGCREEIPGCDIKGNINSKGEKIYHTTSSSSYSKTKIDPSNGERWFCTAEEAVANGWRAPRN